jgi:WYL domain
MRIYSHNEHPEASRRARWSQERRLRFIDFRLQWEGRLNRKDLIEYFGVSVPQASLDISRYAELAPANLSYDLRTRSYVSTNEFQAAYETSSAAHYLTELRALKTGLIEIGSSFVGTGVDVDVAPVPLRFINEQVVVSLVRAIRERRKLSVTYHSVSSGGLGSRQISPHALGNDGFRWHVRAYCHRKNQFIDFVLARLTLIEDSGLSEILPETDTEWWRMISLILAPNPDLPISTQKALELDYGMVNGQVEFSCRQAFLFYTLRRLGFVEATKEVPIVQQIILKNRDDLEKLLGGLNITRAGS